MAVTSKSAVSAPKPQVVSKARSQTVTMLDNSRLSPAWLLYLCQLQRQVSVVTWLLVTAMLVVYGWTMYSQQKWNQAYKHLETLQLHERQLMSTNEVLKNKLALQAQQPDIGLVPPDPAEAIVLQPAAQRPAQATKLVQLTTQPSVQNSRMTKIPTGY